MDMVLAQYRPLVEWKPSIGDLIIWHGWFTHWFGVVSGIDGNRNALMIIKAGLPKLLISAAHDKKNVIEINLFKVQNCRNGEYAVFQPLPENMGVWYV